MTEIPDRLIPARDMKLQSILEYAHHSWNIHREPKTAALLPISRFFRGRCAKLRGLMMLPAQVGNIAIKMQRALDLAHFDVTGKLSQDASLPSQMDKIQSRWQAIMEEQGAATRTRRGGPNWDSEVLENLTAGLKPTEIMAYDVSSATALEASLMSYITTAWTIVETMSGDLWETTINFHPMSLAHLSGRPNRFRKSKDSSSINITDKESKTIPLDLIAMNEFDIKDKMGSILRNRFEFSRLDGLRQAYASAFEKDSAQIEHALTSESLDALSTVRNVIVHRDGLADKEYLKKAKFLKSLPSADYGKPVVLDGEIVVRLVKPAIAAANQLLIGVDEWLVKANRDKSK